MSREELEKRILEARYNLVSSKDKETIDILEELAIKALEQEPIEVEATKLQMTYNQGFEDCKKAVIDELKKWDWQELYLPIHFKENIIDVIPSVNPQEPKTGHWIEHEWEEMREKGYYRCSVCNCGYQRWTKGIRKSDVPYIDGKEYTLRNIDHYCPNCGAKMAESEVQNESDN